MASQPIHRLPRERDTGLGDKGHEIFEPEPQHLPSPEDIAKGYEHQDIRVRAFVIFAIVLFLGIGVSMLVMWFTMIGLEKFQQHTDQQRYAPLSTAVQASGDDRLRDPTRFPEPRLQPSVGHDSTDDADMRALREAQDRSLIAAGFVRDPRTGGVRIPEQLITTIGGSLKTTPPPTTAPAAGGATGAGQ